MNNGIESVTNITDSLTKIKSKDSLQKWWTRGNAYIKNKIIEYLIKDSKGTDTFNHIFEKRELFDDD